MKHEVSEVWLGDFMVLNNIYGIVMIIYYLLIAFGLSRHWIINEMTSWKITFFVLLH